MRSRTYKYRPANPFVHPIHALVTQASQEIERTAFGGEQIEKRDLRKGEPCGAERDVVKEVLREYGRVDSDKERCYREDEGYEDDGSA
jgi:hypothetical protein